MLQPQPQSEPAKPNSSTGDTFDQASLGIGPDIQRFRDIVKGKVREDLQEYITSDEIIAQHGKEHISVPVKEITIPRFVFGSDKEGVGEGEGDGDGQANGAGKKGGREPGSTSEKRAFT